MQHASAHLQRVRRARLRAAAARPCEAAGQRVAAACGLIPPGKLCRGLLAAGLLATTAAVGGGAEAQGRKTVECYCTDKTGSRVELGETRCLSVDGRQFIAQCQMSLNVPMWREVSESCLSSALPLRLEYSALRSPLPPL